MGIEASFEVNNFFVERMRTYLSNQNSEMKHSESRYVLCNEGEENLDLLSLKVLMLSCLD